eukprot:m.29273 g.29273  ORF g.29273 m.29273 type:complete len:199 (-) comp16067_c1_seq1:132-728(-)
MGFFVSEMGLTRTALLAFSAVAIFSMVSSSTTLKSDPTPQCCYNDFHKFGPCHDDPVGHQCVYGYKSCVAGNCVAAHRCECWACEHHECANCPTLQQLHINETSTQLVLPAGVVTAQSPTLKGQVSCQPGFAMTLDISAVCALNVTTGNTTWNFSQPPSTWKNACTVMPNATFKCEKGLCVESANGGNYSLCESLCPN